MTQFCKRLDDYFDDQLSDELRIDFQSHLETCDACRGGLAEMEIVDQQIRDAWSAIVAPANVKVDLDDAPSVIPSGEGHACPQSSAGHWNQQHVFRFAVIVCTGCLLAMLGFWFLGTGSKPGELGGSIPVQSAGANQVDDMANPSSAAGGPRQPTPHQTPVVFYSTAPRVAGVDGEKEQLPESIFIPESTDDFTIVQVFTTYQAPVQHFNKERSQ